MHQRQRLGFIMPVIPLVLVVKDSVNNKTATRMRGGFIILKF